MSGPILVTGIGGPAGRAVSTWLRSEGMDVLGVDAAPLVLDGIECEQVPMARDPEFVDRLRRLAAGAGAALIVPTVSEELAVLSRRRLAFAGEGIEVLLSGRRSVTVADDKLLTASTLARAGIAVPRFAALSREPRDARLTLARLGSPCLTKPRVGRGGRGVAVHRSSGQLAAAWPDEESIAQEFVAGREYAVELALGQGEEIAVVLEKTGLRDGEVGNAAAVVRSDNEDVARLAIEAARAIDLTGPADIDIRRRATGEPVILEVNARFGAWATEAPEVLETVLGFALEEAAAA